MTQVVTTRRNMVAKRREHVAPNNVVKYCIEMLRSFGWGFINYNNQINALAVSGHSAMVYCADKLMENLRVF